MVLGGLVFSCSRDQGELFHTASEVLTLTPYSGKGPGLKVRGDFPGDWNRVNKAHEVRFWSKATEHGRLGQLLVGYYSCGDCRKEGIRNLLISALQQEVEGGGDPLKWEIVQEVGAWKNGAVGFVLRTKDVVNEGHWYKFVVDYPVESKAGEAGFFLRCTGDVGLKLQATWVELVENCFKLKLSVEGTKAETKKTP
jgi:hypothetical protein